MKKSIGREKKSPVRESSSAARNAVRPGWCSSPDALCVRCALLRLTGYRLALFRKKFGRLPTVNDELFFDETQARPVRASPGAIRNQILAAAEAEGLNSPMLLRYLGLGLAADASESEEPRAGSAVLDQAERDGRGAAGAYGTDMHADIRRSRQVAITVAKRRVIGHVGRDARIARDPASPIRAAVRFNPC
jgi:hypothetical protein